MKKSRNKFHIICDVETTGFSPLTNDTIQLAALVFDPENYEVLGRFSEYCSPITPNSWTSGAENIHKISEERAMSFQHPREMGIKFLHFLKPFKHDENDPMTFIYHGIHAFDWLFVKNTFRKVNLLKSLYKVFDDNNIESTVDLANKHKRITGLDNARLKTLAEHFNVKFNHHEAMSDVETTFFIYKKFKSFENNSTQLRLIENEPSY